MSGQHRIAEAPAADIGSTLVVLGPRGAQYCLVPSVIPMDRMLPVPVESASSVAFFV